MAPESNFGGLELRPQKNMKKGNATHFGKEPSGPLKEPYRPADQPEDQRHSTGAQRARWRISDAQPIRPISPRWANRFLGSCVGIMLMFAFCVHMCLHRNPSNPDISSYQKCDPGFLTLYLHITLKDFPPCQLASENANGKISLAVSRIFRDLR